MKDASYLKNWHTLQDHREQLSKKHLKGFFATDSDRFNKMSFTLPGMLVDFSKNFLTQETLFLLTGLAQDAGVELLRDAMMRGDKVNTTESRAVLHTALRAPTDAFIKYDGKNVVEDVHEVLGQMRRFTNSVHTGVWTGHNGKTITDVVNIGIGGSSLGPQLVTKALAGFHTGQITSHFVANVEASDLELTLKGLSPETTLFIIASKTFTTAETMQNARIAREWVLNHYKDDTCVAKHFIACSTNAEAVKTFGIAAENMFPFWDWVGGRYSVWSSIGLSVMLSVGVENFIAFLQGAHEMDTHFKSAPLGENLPVLMALVGIWYRNFMNYPAYAVIPYHAALGRLPAFLQQLDMESNGKSVTRTGQRVSVATGLQVFGEAGTDAQHSFFQWLHQGTDIVPVDFIAAVKTPFGHSNQQEMLLANCLAQSEALMVGQENAEQPHRNFAGNRPSTTILLDELTPRTLGMLLALYEHKVFVQGSIWGINCFDQWGVELGKVLAKALESEIKSGTAAKHNASTLGLMEYISRNKI